MDMNNILYLNSSNMCIVCFMPPLEGYGEQLIKHHVSYFDPEIIAYVHYHCHQKIHDPEKPIKHLIHYKNGDSRKFYAMKKEVEQK